MWCISRWYTIVVLNKEQLKPSWLLIPLCQPLLPAADFLNEFKVDLKNNNDQLTTAADFKWIQRGIKK